MYVLAMMAPYARTAKSMMEMKSCSAMKSSRASQYLRVCQHQTETRLIYIYGEVGLTDQTSYGTHACTRRDGT